jgi:hypothetical protein
VDDFHLFDDGRLATLSGACERRALAFGRQGRHWNSFQLLTQEQYFAFSS